MTKNTSYHYSIIIPHKNTPRLLERCLYSIPTWDEIQIIIIDDNSNSESVDFSHFPGNGRKNTEVLFTKEGKGAGYARNIGLSHARGKWIIFADADDFFTADCFTILNEYMDSPHEVIYFNVRFVMSDNPSQESRRGTYYTNFFNDVNPENKLRYQSQVPWGKMIRRSFLSTFHIQFDETRIANDVYFSCLVGIYGLSRFLAGIIFYTREVLLTSHYEKRLFEHASQPRVACADIRLLSYLWSRTNLSRDSYQSG